MPATNPLPLIDASGLPLNLVDPSGASIYGTQPGFGNLSPVLPGTAGAQPQLVAQDQPQPPGPGQRTVGTPAVPWSQYGAVSPQPPASSTNGTAQSPPVDASGRSTMPINVDPGLYRPGTAGAVANRDFGVGPPTALTPQQPTGGRASTFTPKAEGGASLGAIIPFQPSNDFTQTTGISADDYDKFRGFLAQRESQRYDQPPSSTGKADPPWVMGRYQMGPGEIQQAASELGIPTPTVQQFLSNPELQEQLFQQYTLDHHRELMKYPMYAKGGAATRVALLAGAHLGGVDAWMNGKEVADINGATTGSYINGMYAVATGKNNGIAHPGAVGAPYPTGLPTARDYAPLFAQTAADRAEQQRRDLDLQKRLDALEKGSPEYDAAAREQLDRMKRDEDTERQMIMHPPIEKRADIFANLGSLATVVAVIGGALSRRGLVGSLDAAGAAMEAINTNNHEEWQDAFETWKTKTNMLGNLLQHEGQTYKDILENKRLDWNQKVAQLNMQFQINQNTAGLRAAAAGDLLAQIELPSKLLDMGATYQKKVADADEAEAKAAKDWAENANMRAWGGSLGKDTEEDQLVRSELMKRAKELNPNASDDQILQDARRLARDPVEYPAAVQRAHELKDKPSVEQTEIADEIAAKHQRLEREAKEKGTALPRSLPEMQQDPEERVRARDEIEKRKAVERQGAEISDDTAIVIGGQLLRGDISGLTRLNQASRDKAYQMAINQELPNSAAYFREEEGRDPTEEELRQIKLGIGTRLAAAHGEFAGFTNYERFLGAREAAIHTAVIEAQQLIPKLREAAAKVDFSKYPDINAIYRAVEQHTGDPNVTELIDYTNSFLNIYSRAVAPVGQSAVDVRNMAREQLGVLMGSEQFQRGLDVMDLEMGIALRSPEQARLQRRDEFEHSRTLTPVMPNSFWARGRGGGGTTQTGTGGGAPPPGSLPYTFPDGSQGWRVPGTAGQPDRYFK